MRFWIIVHMAIKIFEYGQDVSFFFLIIKSTTGVDFFCNAYLLLL